VPQTSTDLVKGPGRRWGATRRALDEWRAVVEEWPKLTAESTPSGACDRVRVELGGAWSSSKSRRAASGFGQSCSSS
jgi:hypothetical protein